MERDKVLFPFFSYCNVNACVQAVEFAKLCFSNRKYESKKNLFLWFISLNDLNQELGCGRGVIDVLTKNLLEET
jgi:hypothetical protein